VSVENDYVWSRLSRDRSGITTRSISSSCDRHVVKVTAIDGRHRHRGFGDGPASASQATPAAGAAKLKARIKRETRRNINILRLCADAIQALAGFGRYGRQTTPGEPYVMS